MVSPDADRSVKGGGGMPCAAFGAPIMHPPHMTGILPEANNKLSPSLLALDDAQ